MSLAVTDDRTPLRENFLYGRIADDLRTGKYGGRVVTRFPPEPNGYLHIGHARNLYLNYRLAVDHGGLFHLRFDDTNPAREEVEYVEAIQRDAAWLGVEWGEHLYFASDYFDAMYRYAERLIENGKAYVDSLDLETLRAYRGSFTEPGTNSPYRERSVEENLDLFRRMRAGEFEDGAHVLRAKIDMAARNMVMRDPLLYRIKHAHHHRSGDAWCIYPMYDYAHCIEDAMEGVTHSICTLEFDNNRELYDWVLRETGAGPQDHPTLAAAFANAPAEHPPEQTEVARLNLAHTVMSKRKLRELVEEGLVAGWDDPRMPTLSGLRRRGVRPEAIRQFCEMAGVSKTNSLVDIGKLEFCIRDDLNPIAPRAQVVLDPLKVTITSWTDGTEWTDAPLFPEESGRSETRRLPFAGVLYIERADFAEVPPKKWKRLAPGVAARLRYGYVIRCDEVIHDDAGKVIELRCSHEPGSRGGETAWGPKGTLHWVAADHAVPVEVRLYDRLFEDEVPDAVEGDWRSRINDASLVVVPQALAEPHLASVAEGARFQFERTGYFVVDPDTTPERPVFNRIVTLRDSWAKQATPATEVVKGKKLAEPTHAAPPARSPERDAARAADASLASAFARYLALGLSEADADVLSGDAELVAWADAALEAGNTAEVAKWLTNDVLRLRKDTALDALRFSPTELAELAGLVHEDAITATAAREVFEAMAAGEGSPAAIVDARGLRKLGDANALEALIDGVLEANVDAVSRYRDGKTQLLGFFVGQVMKASGGSADAAAVRPLLIAKLG